METNNEKQVFNKNSTHPLQSWEWGEFRKQWGNKVVKTNFGQIIFSKISPTNFTIGTFIKGPKPTVSMLNELKKIGKEEKAIFIKFESAFVPSNQVTKEKLTNLLRKSGCVPGKTLFTPTTFWIDLTRPEDDILKSFSPKTRYNIRLAQKHGVEIVEDSSDKAFEKYIQLTRETVERQGFYAHSEKYHRLMWKYLHKLPISKREAPSSAYNQLPIATLLTARYKKEVITSWIVFVWHDTLYYPYGASSEKYKNVMANNLMLWEAIRYGKKLGLKTFDLWGREPGKGFTRFKEGYNPTVIEFIGSWDLLINPILYYPYRFLENLRWLVLRLKSKIIKPQF